MDVLAVCHVLKTRRVNQISGILILRSGHNYKNLLTAKISCPMVWWILWMHFIYCTALWLGMRLLCLYRSARVLRVVFIYAIYASGNEIAQFSIAQFKLTKYLKLQFGHTHFGFTWHVLPVLNWFVWQWHYCNIWNLRVLSQQQRQRVSLPRSSHSL